MLVVLAAWLAAPPVLRAQESAFGGHSLVLPTSAEHSVRTGQLTSSTPEPVVIRADYATRFEDGDETVLLLRGQCRIEQGQQRWSAPLMVLWQLPAGKDHEKRILAYLESTLESPATSTSSEISSLPYHLVEITAGPDLQLQSRPPVESSQAAEDPAYLRAKEVRQESRGRLQQTQFTLDAPGGQGPFIPDMPAPRIRQHVTISPKFLGDRLEAKGEISEGSIPPEYVVTITGGVNIVVDNVPIDLGGRTVLSRIDLTADRAVIWTDPNHGGEIGNFDIDSNTPFQIYLEGNIVVRQGTNDIRATHAFYDINQHRGLTMNAELRTFLPDLQGSLRLRATELRQQSDTNYHARDAFLTTSEFGAPKYRLQASDIFLEERFNPNAPLDPATGQPTDGTFWVTSLNNTLLLGDVPVFAAPYLAAPADNPNIPLQRFDVGFSGMFGGVVQTAWDVRSLTGWNLPRGVNWQLQADWLSARGPAAGSRALFSFDDELFGVPVHHDGWGQVYYINDHGLDNLGWGRRALPFQNDNRGRVVLRDRIQIDPNTWIQAEVGNVFNNDRNFMEQYFEHEWDTQKDLEDILVLNRQVDNVTGTLLGTVQSNNFNDQTNWLPKGDLTLLGQPLFGTPVVWSTHSTAGYGQLKPAAAPYDPTLDPFTPLPYFTNVEGLVGMSRHELSMPFNAGPVKVDPYVIGELAYQEQDLTGDSLGRAWGSAGVRGSVEFSKYMPQLRNRFLGLNGLAHKVVFDFDYYYSRSSTSINNMAQYNAFDENAQERFRERMVSTEFNGTLPPQLDPRFYAVRSGAGRDVTTDAWELVDNQNTLWLGMQHRLQTKVGPPEAPRIVDWMEWDLGTAIYPNAQRDNFGETFGLLNTNYAWHVSPRNSILANGVWDFFTNGQSVWNVGWLHQRSARGSAYVGFRQVDVASIQSQLVVTTLSYVLSPNLYVVTAGAQYDVAEGLPRGESMTITRIGEFFLLHLALGYDRSRNNVGAGIMLEPKFGNYGSSSMQLNSLLGIPY